ncbi:hypothetical protein NBRC110019_03490 [Neptunitalea chrysea]|uniref:Purple acid Phosphatase, N-terminal domain n=1 Tax=Neptunitalea chrysea TaxID=1647581 RepID=A0A9W6B320_9FLAO|nr:metallophosphoesterase family protein [Neptunitalea chrysea]GLB51310.1 hypothetical protein NBRC110019_03490 [Neptunitalea chrysea]
MKKIIILALFTCIFGYSQEFYVKPYLQDATPNSIKIMWETNFGEESFVEWGVTKKLGKKVSGKAFDINFTEARVHEVLIEGLQKFTTYYYRVKTGTLVSDIYTFKTPPFASDDKAFNIVAMSDMQIDRRNPNKFTEIIQDGVLSYLSDEFEGGVPDNLALVMIPGDLVSSGSEYDQWQHDFFRPIQPLGSQVPVYPVLGNHERNSVFYFKYFSLPENGTPAFAEHWYYKDYGNTRIIGLNSNEGYRIKDQLRWLDSLLVRTAENDDIDFVFAQLHHPHKSELWLRGEEDYTGEVVKRLENFTNKTGKPSIHFFGHTHGYSRGQSQNHKHLWINVATAGGRIDEWGAYAQKNYDEFTVTQAKYGFVMVAVDPNDGNPKFTVKRVSRGNELNPENNVITDSITIYKNAINPEKPMAVSPKGKVDTLKPLLTASVFKSDNDQAFHAASQWQVSESDDFEKTIFNSWKQFEDWYYDQNLQKGDDLKDEIALNLKPGKTYYWRVRYRDQFLQWSEWSEVIKISTEK